MLTVTAAAKEVGVTRAAIHARIKSGKLSATKNDAGVYMIDAAELFRVYKPIIKHQPEIDSVDSRLVELELKHTKELLRQVESERDSLRVSLTQAMAMLSHQPDTRAPQQPVSIFKRLFW